MKVWGIRSKSRIALLVIAACTAVASISFAEPAIAHRDAGYSDKESDGTVGWHTAPEWPFHGVVSETGVFWNVREDTISRVRLGRLEHCRIGDESEVEHDERFVYFSNTVGYSQNNEVTGTYVVPWGDMAYPLMTNPAMTRKTIGQLAQQSVWDWRSERRGNTNAAVRQLSYGARASVTFANDPGLAEFHLIYRSHNDELHYHYRALHPPMSLEPVPDEAVAELEDRARRYGIQRREEEEAIQRLIENDDYDPHAGPLRVSGPWPAAFDGVHVRWDTRYSGLTWCDGQYGFLLDAATGAFAGCFEGELLEVWQSLPSSPATWAAPLGFSAGECAASLDLWQADPAEWFRRAAARRDASWEQR